MGVKEDAKELICAVKNILSEEVFYDTEERIHALKDKTVNKFLSYIPDTISTERPKRLIRSLTHVQEPQRKIVVEFYRKEDWYKNNFNN